MPLLGSMIGLIILKLLPITPNVVIGIIFFIISIQMIISTFKQEEVVDLKSFISIVLFAFTVSIDSFSVGIGLTAISNNYIFTVGTFSIISGLFTYLGLTIGGQLTEKFGKYATLLGGIILFILSFAYLFFYRG